MVGIFGFKQTKIVQFRLFLLNVLGKFECTFFGLCVCIFWGTLYQGRGEIRWRLGQETSLAPPCSNVRSFGSKYSLPYWRKNLQHCWDFSAPPSDSVPGVLLPPRFVPSVTLHNKVRKFAEPWMSNWEITTTLGRPCIQNAPQKTGETSPAGLTHWKAAQRSSKPKVEWLHLRPWLVLPWCRASRTTWNCCWP